MKINFETHSKSWRKKWLRIYLAEVANQESKIPVMLPLYKYFLRLNNRKSSHHPDVFITLGYPLVRLGPDQEFNEIFNWCLENIGEHRFATDGDFMFAFENDDHYTFFKLTWM